MSRQQIDCLINRCFCVVGAGVTGLAAVRKLITLPNVQVDCFEQERRIGGVWACEPTVSKTSPVYENLRSVSPLYATNFPIEIMTYGDFEIPNSLKTKIDKLENSSFVPWNVFQEYVQLYSETFRLNDHIRLNRRVTSVKPMTEGNGWIVTTESCHANALSNPIPFASHYDAVFVCSGAFHVAHMPTAALQPDLFGGRVIHSSDYVSPMAYAGRTVLIVGCGPSGVDIACDVARVAKQVFLCFSASRNLGDQRFPENVIKFRSRFEKFHSKTAAQLENGQIVDCDDTIFCTGYRFDYSFFSDVDLNIENNQFRSLWHELCHVDFPNSLFFLGIPRQEPVGRLAELQMQFAVAIIQGSIVLPTGQQMQSDIQKELHRRIHQLAIQPHKAHKLGHLYDVQQCVVRSLFRDLVEDIYGVFESNNAFCVRLPNVVLSVLEHVVSRSVSSLRTTRYELDKINGTFEVHNI